jgi:NAD(P)-dependent dehydrogenase (short-subunit alcohol dehydrogenase family)
MRTVLVTGASTGIGRATALHLDARGWRVWAGVRSELASAALRRAAGPRLRTLNLDVTDAAAIEAAADQIGGSLDALVNNAGIAPGGPLEGFDLHQLRDLLEVNVVGQLAVTQALLPALRSARGRIVFMSSVSGVVALPFVGPYAASKHALEAIAGSLRGELAPWGIEVCVVGPGSVRTPIWDKAVAQVGSVADHLPDRAANLYATELGQVEKTLRKVGDAGVSPERVAEVVHRVLVDPRPRTRTTVGPDAVVQIAASRLLPPRTFNRAIRRAFGFSRPVRVPDHSPRRTP